MTDAPIRIVLDAMGGDRAPQEPCLAAAELSCTTKIRILLCGPPDLVKAELDRHPHDASRIEIVPATGAIGMDEKPREAIAAKPEASLCVATRLLRDDGADALVSAGSTGALVLASAQWLPRIHGIERAALAAVYPTPDRGPNRDRFALMLDVGATVRCRPNDLVFFAYMGHAYASRVSKVERPTVGLLNMGTEETKGGEVLAEAHRLLREDPRINFIGNVEGNDIPLGKADVVVCEGLVGNVALKMAEGVGELFKTLGRWAFKQSLAWKIGLALLSSGLRRLKDVTDYSEYGGAPLLGFRQPVLKAHGRSSARAIGNAVKVAAKAVRDGVCPEIEAAVADFEARQGAGPSRSGG
jgi:glycerol-3-phosphate acyltransferase PlsX